ncbi:MAG: carboxylating nicotinate-nucleotide diphosphorylase [bacterium]|nr:MAG: carboxylating nicotinate-nucleotide diphosphorylase [bacterium]
MPELPDPVLRLIDLAVEEDVGVGDLTSLATVGPEDPGEADIIARQEMVCCGLDLARLVFERVGRGTSFRPLAADGDAVAPGTIIAEVSGPLRVILAGERTALNFLQRMCGVATLSRRYADKAAGVVAILDSRKTIPGWRWLDKRAVRVGGCSNHRMGLFDGILIKDNHVAACGGVARAVSLARKKTPPGMSIEVEVEDIRGLEEALESGADVVMLDNFSPGEVARAVHVNDGRVRLEVSGGISLQNLEEYLKIYGVDFLSVGALTHSAPAADIAMEIRHRKAE